MTREHYRLFAAMLKDLRRNHGVYVDSNRGGTLTHVPITLVAGYMANIFQQDNPRFNRVRFFKAAGEQ